MQIMMHRLARFSLWITPVLFLSICPSTLYSAQMGEEKAEKASAHSAHRVTGCLQKGEEEGGFTITAEDGKVWELHGKKVPLASHVGHTVTVTGSPAKESKAEEEKIEANEKKEAGEKKHGDLRVSSLKMVSDSCK
jgi:hypothetical protein